MSLRADVDRGLAIVEEIKGLELELEAIESRLEQAGLQGDQIELIDPEREGRQFLAKGSDAIVPVVFTSDLLVKSFADASAAHAAIETSAEGKLASFFKPVKTWKTLFDSGKIFRRKAAEILGDEGPAFVSACVQRDKHGIPKSATKIEWNRKIEL